MIATTIKKQYLDEIEAGTKKIDYRACKDFWRKKFSKFHSVILFLSGRKVKAYHILKVEAVNTPSDLKHVIDTDICYAIHLGGVYRWPRQMELIKEAMGECNVKKANADSDKP